MSDFIWYVNLMNNVEQAILPSLLTFSVAYNLSNQYWASLSFFSYWLIITFSRSIFANIVMISFFLSIFLVYQRVLKSASPTTQLYSMFALTFVLIVFFIMSITGAFEPYQSAIIFILFYLFQARYRTSALTIKDAVE